MIGLRKRSGSRALRRSDAIVTICLAVALAGLIGCSQASRGAPSGDRLKASVVRDVDGDTVYVRYADGSEGYVRLLGVDTPEDVKPDYPAECGARAAASSMRTMAEGRKATLVTDLTQDRFDRYGRLLAYLYVGGRNLDEVQVRDGRGYVYVYEGDPFEQVRRFRAAQLAAEREGAGVWGSCGGDFHSAESGTQN